jgi:hypothetical protein
MATFEWRRLRGAAKYFSSSGNVTGSVAQCSPTEAMRAVSSVHLLS